MRLSRTALGSGARHLTSTQTRSRIARPYVSSSTPASFQLQRGTRRTPFICARCLHNTSRQPQSTSSTSQQTQPPPPSSKPKSNYDLFPATLSSGPPPSGPFHIELPALRREFLQLQAQAHPDRHTDPSMKHRAEATSAALNDAYKTLTDPLLRARHILLTQTGIDLEGDESAKESDMELLGVVMEAREVIEGAEKEEELEELRVENQERIKGSVEVLGGLMEKGDWEAAKRESVRLRYWRNVEESIRAWEPGKPTVLVH